MDSTVHSQKGEDLVDSEKAVVHGIEAKGDGESQPTMKAKVLLVFFRLIHASRNPARSPVGSDLHLLDEKVCCTFVLKKHSLILSLSLSLSKCSAHTTPPSPTIAY